MTKNDLAKEVAVSERLHLSTAVKAVDGILRVIRETLAKGDDIHLRGLGTLSVIDRGPRPARHFSTGEPITIPAHRTVKLRLSKELKDALNNGTMD